MYTHVAKSTELIIFFINWLSCFKICVFILDSLEIKKDSYIDINKYAEESNIPLKFNQSASTICSIKSDMTSHPNRMKSNKRQLIAIGKLKAPYCVWVRK